MDFHVPLRSIDEGEHFVQFYEDPAMLYEGLARYVFEALGRDGKALLVVTREHATTLRGRLAARGLDVERVLSTGALSIVYADDLLPRLLVDGRVDEQAFDRFVGDVVRGASADSEQSVYVFGELVNILWQRRELKGLLHLERLWNALLAKTNATLYCAYQVAQPPTPESDYAKILGSHTSLGALRVGPGTAGVLLQLTALTPSVVTAVSRSLAGQRPMPALGAFSPRAAR